MMPYTDGSSEVWSGFFSSRPAFKKTVKDTSTLFHAYSKMFAQQVLKQNVKDRDLLEILKAKDHLLDVMGIMTEHNNIAGDIIGIV